MTIKLSKAATKAEIAEKLRQLTSTKIIKVEGKTYSHTSEN